MLILIIPILLIIIAVACMMTGHMTAMIVCFAIGFFLLLPTLFILIRKWLGIYDDETEE